MRTQVDEGHMVTSLWPGKMGIISKRVSVCQRKKYYGIHNFELINPLPVPLDEGIASPEEFMKHSEKKVFMDFLGELIPDVIHIHTLMGLYSEFIEAANELKIRTIFTSHDYFGICPKVTFYNNGSVCDYDHECKDCVVCNRNGLSLTKITIMQSPLYRVTKNSTIVNKLRKRHRSFFFDETLKNNEIDLLNISPIKIFSYQKLRTFYVNMLNRIDLIHFNSTVAQSVYHRFISPKNEKVITITNREIRNQKHIKNFSPDIIKFVCLAPAKPYKGFEVIRDAFDQLWNEGYKNFEINVFSPVKNPSTYMKVQENGYRYEELPMILEESDVLLAPSVWYETFGFTVLEALSYGVPVIVSNNVGAKDVIFEGGKVVLAGDVDDLKNIIKSLDVQKLQSMNKNIVEEVPIKNWHELIIELYSIYREYRLI
jgi:glycosyltransferase involved in cell wall biosynthesis